MSTVSQPPIPTLQPLSPPPDWVPGRYAWFPATPEPMYGPDELGMYRSAIDQLTETVNRAESSARIWEVLQAWEARLFARGYHFLNGGRKGWSMWGGVNGQYASGAEIMQTQNQGRLFPVNVYGARLDKVVSVLAMDVPGLTFVPKTDSDPIDQTAADEKKKYLKVWLNDAGIKDVARKIADLFYTDDRVVLLTWSVADEQAWGTEQPMEQLPEFGMEQPEGVTPENELEPGQPDTEKPAVRELTCAYGKLEARVPIYADDQRDMPWLRIEGEVPQYTMQERWPWIADKITAGGHLDGAGDLARLARINVRLAVQTSSSSGESTVQDGTESFTFFRPSQYRAIKDPTARKIFYETFPKGIVIVHAAGEFACCWQAAFDKHLKVLHAKEGPGQNRRAIGTNYLPLQKILNSTSGLLYRYYVSCVPKRFHKAGDINSEAINSQTNDPATSIPVELDAGESIDAITGVEKVPQPANGMFEFIQWLIMGAPEIMDGMEPAMFGAATGEADQGVYQTARLKRDAARGIYSQPWSQICIGLAKAAEQAAECAAANRIADISSNIPGQRKLVVEIAKMQGDAYCYPESLEIPQSIAEQEERMSTLIEASPNVPIYQAIVNDPRNLTEFAKFPSLNDLTIPGLDAVKQQEGELELLVQSGPQPNPQLLQAQRQIQQAQTDPEAQTPDGQQMLQQLQQAAQSLPPMVSSVPVAQDGSENHVIHAAIALGFLESAEGRKLKFGNDKQKQVYENIHLHWQEHEAMAAKLTPVKPLEVRANATVAVDKLPPNVQAQALQAMGVQAMPADFVEQDQGMVPHEVTTEKEGIDANGVPVKQKISMVNPKGKLQ